MRIGPFRLIREGLLYGGLLAMSAILVARWVGRLWSLPVFALATLVVAFFRDPDRVPPEDPSLLVAPADGTVTAVEPCPDGTRISIFLSIFDVHVNRSPSAGRIAAIDYRPGKFRNAMLATSATENERNVITLDTAAGRLVFTQIAGLLARRIVFHPHLGDHLERGQRVGMIKFGSRTDAVLPPGAASLVRVGQHVLGGSSPIARV